jgi:glyoxylase-like metal-dependent hydrolase (beta-lactamase superfamily II)
MASDDPMNSPEVREIAPGVYVRVAVDNTAWIDLGDDLAVVDTLEQPELEEEVFAHLERLFPDKPVRYVINTHTHYDHVALNGAFERRCGAEVLNQKTTPLDSQGRMVGGTERSLALDLSPGCHTKEDWLVWLPVDRILFVGDLFGWGVLPWPGNLKQETWDRIDRVYRRVVALNPVCVVPGHGPLCGVSDLRRCRDYFEQLIASVDKLCAGGASDEEIVAQLPPPDDMRDWWRFTLWKHDDNVTKVLKAVRRGILKSTSCKCGCSKLS